MGTPMVVAYKVDPTMTFLRYVLKLHSVVLANLVLGGNVFPELLQERCTPELLAEAITPLLSNTPERQRQLAGLARIPQKLRLPRARRAKQLPTSCCAMRERAAGRESRREPVSGRSDFGGVAPTSVRPTCHVLPRSARAALDGDVLAVGGADVELARTADLLLGILDHLLPLGDPADRARHREQHA